MMNITANKTESQPWLNKAWVDGLFILSPPFIALWVVALFPDAFKNSAAMPVMYWVILIVMIDVAHVYSTLYRTYFQTSALKRQPRLIIIPLLCYLAGVMLYAVNGMLFWRILAYLAVFHFIRQQYGFMRLYSRKENQPRLFAYIDTITIYAATIYPLIYWHLAGTRKFNWFIDGDFISWPSLTGIKICSIIYGLAILVYVVKEVYHTIKRKQFNIPRNLIIAGTFLSWYFGIIYFNGDMAFTTLNVVSHGIPYMALIWIAERKKYDQGKANSGILRVTFNTYAGVIIFVGLLIALAYLEEGLWDGFVWREHLTVFKPFKILPLIEDNIVLAFLVPFLALPQSTHYVLDGFIWKLRKHGF